MVVSPGGHGDSHDELAVFIIVLCYFPNIQLCIESIVYKIQNSTLSFVGYIYFGTT